MKLYKILVSILFFCACAPCFATVSQIFDGQDTNALKAGISKYILTRGGNVNHGDSYSNNLFQATEQIRTSRGTYTYIYVFSLTPAGNGTRLDLKVLKAQSGVTSETDLDTERKIMEAIASSINGRFLYGLGFDFEYYDTPKGKIKAPKGHDNGIVLTAAKYDAHKQGLLPGDIITEINGVALKDIPLEEFATILFARSLTDSLTLTYTRNGVKSKVTLTPRLSNTKVF